MSPQNCNPQTRRTKRHAVRAAVLAVLRGRARKRTESCDLYEDIVDDIVEDIQTGGHCEMPVDAIDVSRALRALHARGDVCVAHYDAEGRFVHSVTLLKW